MGKQPQDYLKVIRTIRSCTNYAHLEVTGRVLKNYGRWYPDSPSCGKLSNLLWAQHHLLARPLRRKMSYDTTPKKGLPKMNKCKFCNEPPEACATCLRDIHQEREVLECIKTKGLQGLKVGQLYPVSKLDGLSNLSGEVDVVLPNGICVTYPRSLFRPSTPPAPDTDEPTRTFDTGATRDQDITKPNYDGFFSVPVIERFGQYMQEKQVQSDGELRAADNWKLGIPIQSYRESMWRHFFDVLKALDDGEDAEVPLCALKFNVDGMLHEVLK